MCRIAALLLALATFPLSAATVRLRPVGAIPAGCEAHVATLDREVTGKCGEAVEIPGGEAVGWIEAPGVISRTVAVSSGGDFGGLDLVRAGHVIVAPARTLETGEHAEVIAANFERPVAAGKAATVPEGTVLAVVFGRRNDAVAIAKPRRVTGSEAVRIEVTAANDLLAILQRPRESNDSVTVTADGRAPEAFINSRDSVVAAWYGVTARNARLAIESKTLRLPLDSVSIARAGVTTVRQRLEMLPTLTVSIAHVDVPLPPLKLAVLDELTDALLVEPLSAKAGKTYEFEHLPAVKAVVRLEVGAFRAGKRVDLTSGHDASVNIPLEPVPVSGTVYEGNTPAHAEVRFMQKGDPIRATTDDQGRYSITLWEERRYLVNVALLDKPATPPIQDFIAIRANQTLDFHIPAMHFAARVFDSETHAPVTKATVSVQSRYTDVNGKAAGSAISFPSDALPITELPPQRPGTSTIIVSAPSYFTSEPVIVQIDESVTERVVDVPMRRVGETIPVDLRLPDGSPAAGAQVAASPDAMNVAWQGPAGADGHIDVPKAFDGMLLIVRHQRAASTTTRLASAPVVVTMGQAAPPLQLTVVIPEQSRAGMPIVAWIGGVKLAQTALAFAAWTGMTATDFEHHWLARNLPAEPLRVLAVRMLTPQVMGGAYDAVAPVVPYPWPANASIPRAD